ASRRAKTPLEELQDRRPRHFEDAQATGDDGLDVLWVPHGRQIDKGYAVGEGFGEARLRLTGDFERQPSLAAAADADQGEQRAVAHVRERLAHIALAPEERR